LHPDAAPDKVPMDVWRTAVEIVQAESTQNVTTAPLSNRPDTPQDSSGATLQVLELVRIPYTKVNYRYGNQDYIFCAYDGDGQEKFYADRYPARWDRIERLVRAISNDLMIPAQQENASASNNTTSGYRVPIEVPPYTVTEEDEDAMDKH